MDIEKYLNTPVILTPCIDDGKNSDLRQKVYGAPIPDVMCWVEGGLKIYIGENRFSRVSVDRYVTKRKVEADDLLDGQIVLLSKPIRKFGRDSAIQFYEAYVGEAR